MRKLYLSIPIELLLKIHPQLPPGEEAQELGAILEANRQRVDQRLREMRNNRIKRDYSNALNWIQRRRPDLSEEQLRWHMKFNEPYKSRVEAMEALEAEEGKHG